MTGLRSLRGLLRYVEFKSIAMFVTVFTLLLMVLVPLTILLISSFRPKHIMPIEASAVFTLENYILVFVNSKTYELLLNTFVYTGGVILLGVPIAVLMAWLTERTNMPFGNLLFTLMFIPMAIPGMITALGYGLLLNPNNGMLNVILRAIGGETLAGMLNAYSMSGMIFVTALGIAPSMYIMLTTLMRNMDSNLEEASQTSGGSSLNTFRRITIPLITPGILSVMIYFIIVAIEIFEVPLILGLNGGVRVLSTEVYLQTVGRSELPNYGLASTYGIITLFLGVILILVYLYFTRFAQKYQVISGKNYKSKRIDLGPWKWVGLGFIALFMFVKLILPLGIIVWSSLLPYYQTLSYKAVSMLSFANYASIFANAQFGRAMKNTAILVICSSTAVTVLALFASWLAVRTKHRASRLIELLTFIPQAFPSVIIAVAVLLTFISTPIYGTIWIIIAGYPLRYLPYVSRLLSSSLMQISKELEETALVHGGNHWDSLKRVVFPLVVPAFLNGWLWVAAHVIRDLTFPIFLVSGTNIVIATLLFDYWNYGQSTMASAVAIILVILVLLIVIPARRYINRTSA